MDLSEEWYRNNRKTVNLLTLAFGIFSALITIISGCRGIYFFDGSIPILFGHLLQNGRTCFNEILMPPIGPLTGYLIAVAFLCFGRTYFAAVCMTGLVCGVAGAYSFRLLCRKLPPIRAMICSFFLVVTTLPVPGILFYNDLALLLICVLFVLGICRCFSFSEASFEYEMWFVVGLLFLVKPHFGGIWGVALLSFDILCHFILKRKWDFKRMLIGWMIPFLCILLFLLLAKFNIKGIIESATNSLPPDGKAYFFFNIWDPFKRIEIRSPLYAGLFLLLILIDVLRKKMPSEAFCLVLWNCILGGIVFLFSILSCYAWTYQYFFFGTVCVTYFILYQGTLGSRRLYMGISILLLWVIVSFVMLIWDGGFNLKKWSEPKGKFSASLDQTIKMEGGFFHGIRIQKHQRIFLLILNEITNKFPSKKIYFGPELGILYPAFNRMPPTPWYLWEDRRVIRTNTDFALSKLIEENYDMMVFMQHTQEPPDYMCCIAQVYSQNSNILPVPEIGIVFIMNNDNFCIECRKIIQRILLQNKG